MRVIFNKVIPFKGFMAINLFGVVFVREEYKDKLDQTTLNHEAIHTAQMKEMLFIGFYLWYFFEWLIKLCIYGKNAYWYLLHEQEAFLNEADNTYITTKRKPFAWLGYRRAKK